MRLDDYVFRLLAKYRTQNAMEMMDAFGANNKCKKCALLIITMMLDRNTNMYDTSWRLFINYTFMHLMIMMGPTDCQIALDANTQDEEYWGTKCHSGTWLSILAPWGQFWALHFKLKKGAKLLFITCRGGIGNWHIYKEGGLDTWKHFSYNVLFTQVSFAKKLPKREAHSCCFQHCK